MSAAPYSVRRPPGRSPLSVLFGPRLPASGSVDGVPTVAGPFIVVSATRFESFIEYLWPATWAQTPLPLEANWTSAGYTPAAPAVSAASSARSIRRAEWLGIARSPDYCNRACFPGQVQLPSPTGPHKTSSHLRPAALAPTCLAGGSAPGVNEAVRARPSVESSPFGYARLSVRGAPGPL